MARKSKKQMAQELFLEAYVVTGSIARAFDVAKEKAEEEGLDLPLHRQRHYEWIVEDGAAGENYRERFFAADETATQVLEGEAFRRAYEGVTDWRSDGDGGLVEIRKYSDPVLMFLLKARRPDRYRERFDHRVGGSPGAIPIGVAVKHQDADEGEELGDDFIDAAWDELVAHATPAGEGPADEAGPS